ncbi:LOW QUALITY PROTEIN: tigger transposable element-derived protein 6-like [Galendromus occidentalis]|uniref:LOW QUALITY PROTEIN: tigger transposable element-derived protein 6-like n=1 Tax=Galendromus occidentalis TaxID=34638 RepID=A0AAJ7SEZ7_9ACAR|nr:LOW QUALITY PROTEIN: tigger transposable element-derived protein 6-like [Galendromus occidentalis]
MALQTRRKQFSLKEKLEVLEELRSGVKKVDVARRFGISKSTLSTFLKNRQRLEEEGVEFDPERKRLRTAKYERVDKATFLWLQEMRSNNVPVSGPLLRERAVLFARSLGHPDFQASEGWLARFKERYGIRAKVLCGESSDAPIEKANEWKDRFIREVIAAYSPDDVFNADEAGLFYQLLPERMLAMIGDACKGGKKSKLRLTTLFCCNASGTEKRRILIVGKSAKPRCLRDVRSLLCQYRGNRNAWMTRDLFTEWLIRFDKDMRLQKRSVLLLIDNCSAHMSLPRMSNIRVENFPPNCTSVLQPSDLGIIRAVKANYRKDLVRRILVNLEVGSMSKVDVKAAMDMIAHAWSEVKSETIRKCWKNSGLLGLAPLQTKTVVKTRPIFLDSGMTKCKA